MTIGTFIDAVLEESRKAGIGVESVRFGDDQRPADMCWYFGKHHFLYSFSLRDELEARDNPKFVEYLVGRARCSLIQLAKEEHERNNPSKELPPPDDFMQRAMDACSGLS